MKSSRQNGLGLFFSVIISNHPSFTIIRSQQWWLCSLVFCLRWQFFCWVSSIKDLTINVNNPSVPAPSPSWEPLILFLGFCLYHPHRNCFKLLDFIEQPSWTLAHWNLLCFLQFFEENKNSVHENISLTQGCKKVSCLSISYCSLRPPERSKTLED